MGNIFPNIIGGPIDGGSSILLNKKRKHEIEPLANNLKSFWALVSGKTFAHEISIATGTTAFVWVKPFLEKNDEPEKVCIQIWMANSESAPINERVRMELDIHLDFKPIEFRSVAGTSKSSIKFNGESYTAFLSDGSEVPGTIPEEALVLPNDVLTILQFWFQTRPDALSSNSFEVPVFSPNSLQSFTLKGEKTEAGWQTNLNLNLVFNHQGELTGWNVLSSDIAARQIPDAKFPKWTKPDFDIINQTKVVRKPAISETLNKQPFSATYLNHTTYGTIISSPQSAETGKVFFIAGSGVHDRFGVTENGLDMKSFILAETLAGVGFSTLLIDKPGAGETERMEDFLEPSFKRYVESQVQVLRTYWGDKKHGKQILIGHSLGGIVSLLLSQQFDLDGLVLLACPGKPMNMILEEQVTALTESGDVSQEAGAMMLSGNREFFKLLETHDFDEIDFPEHIQIGSIEKRWYHELIRIDPSKIIRQVDCPILILQGEKDVQVIPDNANELHNAAPTDTTLSILKNHNHLFQYIKDRPSLSQYKDSRRRFSKITRREIVRWLRAI